MSAEIDIPCKSHARQRAERIRLHLSKADREYARALPDEDWRIPGENRGDPFAL